MNFKLSCWQDQVGAYKNHHNRENTRIIPIQSPGRKILNWNEANILKPLRVFWFLSLEIYEKGVPKLKVDYCDDTSRVGVLWAWAERDCEHNYLSKSQRTLLIKTLLVRRAHWLQQHQEDHNSHICKGKPRFGVVFLVNETSERDYKNQWDW